MKREPLWKELIDFSKFIIGYRPFLLILTGLAIALIGGTIVMSFHLPDWIMVLVIYACLGFILLGVLDLGAEAKARREYEEEETEEEPSEFERIMSKLEEMDGRIRRIENRMEVRK